MTNSIVDNNGNEPITPFSEFVDSVFTELNSPANEWYADLREYSYYYKPTYWENTLIPLAVRLYELAENDVAIYWWLIREMSLVDLCKASKEDFRKRDVFEVLLQLKPDHRRIILENSVPKHAEELQNALDNDDLETFRSLLPLIADDDTIYNIGRVLMRVDKVRGIFERTIHDTKGDSLGRLFVLFREYYRYYANEYNYKNRYCDGLANNVFLALYQTQYREDKVEFCDVAIEIGKLWVKNLILVDFFNKDNMPKSAREVLHNILQSQNASDFHDLETTLSFCDTEKQTIEKLIKPVGGWMDLEKYAATFGVFNHEWRKTTPPFSCRCFNVRRSVRRPVQRNGNVEHRKVQDNCVPYIDSKNAIPMEDLEKLKAQEVNKNIEIQQPIAVYDCDPIPAAEVKGHGVKAKSEKPQREFEPMWFPENIAISPDHCKRFLEILHSKLCTSKYLMVDSKCDFVFIFGGVDDSSSHHPVDWQNDDKATLKAFCSAFYDMPKMRGRKPWSKLSLLFTFKGEPIKKLSENANEVYGTDLEDRMKRLIKSALDDLEKEI